MSGSSDLHRHRHRRSWQCRLSLGDLHRRQHRPSRQHLRTRQRCLLQDRCGAHRCLLGICYLNPYTTSESGWSDVEGELRPLHRHRHRRSWQCRLSLGDLTPVDNTAPVVSISAPPSTVPSTRPLRCPPRCLLGICYLNPYTTSESGWSDVEGAQTYTVTATDGAGNARLSLGDLHLSTTPPQSSASPHPSTVPSTRPLRCPPVPSRIRSQPVHHVRVRLVRCRGAQTYTVTATDGAGNVGSASVTYTVDNTAPVVSISAPVNGAFYKTAAVPTGAFSVSDLNPYTTSESGWSDVEGAQTYTVTATDGAGNVGSASVTSTPSTTPPQSSASPHPSTVPSTRPLRCPPVPSRYLISTRTPRPSPAGPMSRELRPTPSPPPTELAMSAQPR